MKNVTPSRLRLYYRYIDVFFVNNRPFYFTRSKKIVLLLKKKCVPEGSGRTFLMNDLFFISAVKKGCAFCHSSKIFKCGVNGRIEMFDNKK